MSDRSKIARPVGRPKKAKVDPAIAKAICAHLEIGVPVALAAEAEGISRSTAYRWVEQHPAFADRISQASARGGIHLHCKALEGGPGSSQATWLLERRFREFYGLPRADAASADVKITIVGGLPEFPQ